MFLFDVVQCYLVDSVIRIFSSVFLSQLVHKELTVFRRELRCPSHFTLFDRDFAGCNGYGQLLI